MQTHSYAEQYCTSTGREQEGNAIMSSAVLLRCITLLACCGSLQTHAAEKTCQTTICTKAVINGMLSWRNARGQHSGSNQLECWRAILPIDRLCVLCNKDDSIDLF